MKYIKSAIISILILAFLTLFGVGMYYLYAVWEWSVLLVILVGLLVLNFVSSIIIFIQRRNLMSKLSWLLVINIFPFFGAVIFYIFGQRYSGRKEYFKYMKNDYIKSDNYEVKSSELISMISNMTKRGKYQANFEFYNEGNNAFDSLFKDLMLAKNFIHLHYYIVKPGEIYEELKSILIKKAKEGVEVRFIIDDFGKWGMPYHHINELKKAGIQIGVFGPVYFPFLGSENGYRTHRKMAIIDGKIVHTGGLNIANEYASLSKKYGIWLDFQGKITGNFVNSQSLLFLQDWKMVTGNALDYSKYTTETSIGKSVATLVEDSPENKENIIENALVKLISNAKNSIKIATPYFVPSTRLYSAIKSALMMGVSIDLYIPGIPDKKSVYTATKYNANKLQKFGLRIHEMKNMLIHSKIGLFDNSYAYFGTANFDIRSIYSNFETLNVFEGKDISKIIKAFDYYESLSKEVKEGEYAENYLREKFQRIFINLFSPIM